MIIKIMKPITYILIACSVAAGQYKDGNRIVTLSKSYLKPLITVEEGSQKERSKLFDENRLKMDIRDNLLISSNVLYHYLSGRSDEVIVLDEWNNIMDADKSIKTTADRRKKRLANKKNKRIISKKIW